MWFHESREVQQLREREKLNLLLTLHNLGSVCESFECVFSPATLFHVFINFF